MDLDVGIIFTDESEWIRRLITTAAGSGTGLDMRLLLVQNSEQRPERDLLTVFPRTELIVNQRALTYAANLNRLLQRARSRYVLLLNTDMFFDVEEQCLTQMVRFMDAHQRCGVAGCRLHHADGSPAYGARRLPSPAAIVARRLPAPRLFPRELVRYLYQDKCATDSFECDWISGCFLIVRRRALNDVGYFDTRYTKYFEDVDYCQRMWRCGWRVMTHGATYVYHHEQRGSRRWFSRDAGIHLASYVRWLHKWRFPGKLGSRPTRSLAPWSNDQGVSLSPPRKGSAASTIGHGIQ